MEENNQGNLLHLRGMVDKENGEIQFSNTIKPLMSQKNMLTEARFKAEVERIDLHLSIMRKIELSDREKGFILFIIQNLEKEKISILTGLTASARNEFLRENKLSSEEVSNICVFIHQLRHLNFVMADSTIDEFEAICDGVKEYLQLSDFELQLFSVCLERVKNEIRKVYTAYENFKLNDLLMTLRPHEKPLLKSLLGFGKKKVKTGPGDDEYTYEYRYDLTPYEKNLSLMIEKYFESKENPKERLARRETSNKYIVIESYEECRTIAKEEIFDQVDTNRVVFEIANYLSQIIKIVEGMKANNGFVDLFCHCGIVCEEIDASFSDPKGVLETIIPVKFCLGLDDIKFADNYEDDTKIKKKIEERFPPITGLVNPNGLFNRLSKLGFIKGSSFDFSQYLKLWLDGGDMYMFDINIDLSDQNKKSPGENAKK